MANNKIGFLASGSGGNPTGIGDYVRKLDENNIPSVTMCNDGIVGLGDVFNLNTTVDHVMLFRVVRDGSEYYSVPDYNKSPYEAAVEHWNKIRPFFPNEVVQNKERVWIKPVNEVDHERSDWLGFFAVELAKIANAEGFKVSMFGFSSGEPEVEDWYKPGMVAWLNYCANNKEFASICLHEYSFTVDNILDGYPYKVGRFQFLFDACDDLNIPRPYVLIGEWGWEHSNVPDPTTAINHIDTVAAIYAKYKDLLGAGIWYLGKYGNSNIHNQTQKLIVPVTDLTVSKEYPGEEPPSGCSEPRLNYNRTFVFIHKNVELDKAVNIAREAFGSSHTVGFSADDAGFGVDCLSVRKIKAYGVPEEEKQNYINFWNQHYTGAKVTFYDVNTQPPPLDVMFGLHATADPSLAPGELNVFNVTKPDLIKVLSNINPNDLQQLKQQHPEAKFIVRAFLDFGGRVITPEQFVNDTLPDLQRTLNITGPALVEIHNEPNLVQEGLGTSWADGTAFVEWFIGVVVRYKNILSNINVMYPGLSPGETIPGIRQDHISFLEQSRNAVNLADTLGVHAYWAFNYPMANAVAVVRDIAERFPGKPVYVTEASNNKEAPPELKGFEYLTFWKALGVLPTVRGITYFIASASHQDFQDEVWVKNGQSTGIAEKVAERLQ